MSDKAWLYSQSRGCIWSPAGRIVFAQAYSGHKAGLNNPTMERKAFVGPIPRGEWCIGPVYDSERVGPHAIVLVPRGHSAHGRNYFRMHGDNSRGDKSASYGCVIAPRDVRELIGESEIKTLWVVE